MGTCIVSQWKILKKKKKKGTCCLTVHFHKGVGLLHTLLCWNPEKIIFLQCYSEDLKKKNKTNTTWDWEDKTGYNRNGDGWGTQWDFCFSLHWKPGFLCLSHPWTYIPEPLSGGRGSIIPLTVRVSPRMSHDTECVKDSEARKMHLCF